MQSRWFHLKDSAIEFRRLGNSIRDIERMLHIPRSTLSGWLRNIHLTKKQRVNLDRRWHNALIKARIKAATWHNEQKRIRLKNAQNKAAETFSKIDLKNQDIVNLALAMLYLGEGSKRSSITSMGNSDPLILRFFISAIRKKYGLSLTKFICDLHLRADQDPTATKKYWSQELGIPMINFKSVIFDPRTEGSKTYQDYKGVCVVRCGLVEIQRELVFLSRLFCEKAIKYLNN